MEPVFSGDDVRRLEAAHPEGIPSAAVLELLKQRGVELTEATLRKYVQLGLLPRSHRVGRKGKHRGSLGLYPVGIVGRIAEIRALMDGGLTLEEIRRSAAACAPELDSLRRTAEALVDRLEAGLAERGEARGTALARLRTLRGQAQALVTALSEATRDMLPAEPTPVVEQDPAELARQAVRALDAPRRRARGASNTSSRQPATRPASSR